MVVQIGREATRVYARWLGRRLPRKTEREYAPETAGRARNLDIKTVDSAGRPLANFWQGLFPTFNSDQYGFKVRAPGGCFADNQAGVYGTVDNVLEQMTATPALISRTATVLPTRSACAIDRPMNRSKRR